MFQSLVGDIPSVIDWSQNQISVRYFLVFPVHLAGSETVKITHTKKKIHEVLQLHDVETFQNSMYELQHTGYECKTLFHACFI